MSLLLYKSNEMFSSTELIRKSKTIFNKIIDKEIEKAIIMRDGKPGFLLMDFSKYEEIMAEFEKLKSKKVSTVKVNNQSEVKNKSKEELFLSIDEIKVEQKQISQSVEVVSKKPIVKNPIPPSKVVPPRPIEEEQIIEKDKEDDTFTNQSEIDNTIEENEKSEEQEIQEALDSIKAMNFDDDMKAMAEQKIKEKILLARQERARLKEQEELENKDDLKEELEIQVQIKEVNKKKERELKEFWD